MLTPKESTEAAALGWQLRDVYDLSKRRWMLTAMPLDFPTTSVAAMMHRVVEQARGRNGVALKALSLISQSIVCGRPTR